MQKEISKKSFISQIFSMFRPFWKPIFGIVFIFIITQAIGTFAPFLFGKSVDSISKGDMRLTFSFLLIAFCVAVFQGIALWWTKEIIEVKQLDQHIEKSFSVFSLNRMLQFSIGQHVNEHSGVKQTIITKGQNSLNDLMKTMFYDIFPNSLQIIVTLIILAILDWKIAMIALFFATLYILFAIRRNKICFL